MKAYILAAGEATRLRPLSYGTPKLLAQVGARPILEWILDRLGKSKKIEEAVVIIKAGDVHEKALENYISHRVEYFSNNLKVSIEHALGWETGGDLSLALRNQENKGLLNKNEDFLVVYGDIISDVDIERLLNVHEKAKKKLGSLCTITLFEVPVEEAGRFGVADGVKIEEDLYKITKFVEKPAKEMLPSQGKVMVNAGYTVVSNEIFSNFDEFLPARKVKLESYLFSNLAAKEKLAGYLSEIKMWMDIGTIQALEDANRKIYRGEGVIPPPPINKR
jgi:mannose-1-phosphate guanylyltransferase